MPSNRRQPKTRQQAQCPAWSVVLQRPKTGSMDRSRTADVGEGELAWRARGAALRLVLEISERIELLDHMIPWRPRKCGRSAARQCAGTAVQCSAEYNQSRSRAEQSREEKSRAEQSRAERT
eukprot:1409020-Rhodomonas_salina.1